MDSDRAWGVLCPIVKRSSSISFQWIRVIGLDDAAEFRPIVHPSERALKGVSPGAGTPTTGTDRNVMDAADLRVTQPHGDGQPIAESTHGAGHALERRDAVPSQALTPRRLGPSPRCRRGSLRLATMGLRTVLRAHQARRLEKPISSHLEPKFNFIWISIGVHAFTKINTPQVACRPAIRGKGSVHRPIKKPYLDWKIIRWVLNLPT